MSNQLNNEMLAAYKKLLSAAVDYSEYDHRINCWEVDTLEIDDLSDSGELTRFKEILDKFEGEQ